MKKFASRVQVMKSGFFSSASLKLRRAALHRSNLQVLIENYWRANTVSVVVDKAQGDQHQAMRAVLTSEFPLDEFSLVVGDCLHNLRSAMDHVCWDLVTMAGANTPEREVAFPSGKTRADFEAKCDRLFRSRKSVEVCCWPRSKFKEFEVFDGGSGEDLYYLLLANNIDKHRSFFFSVLGYEIPNIEVVYEDGSSGQLLHNTFFGAKFPLVLGTVPDSARVIVSAAKQAKMDVYFKDLPYLQPVPVIDALRSWEHAVGQVILGLDHLAVAGRFIGLPLDYRLYAFDKK